MVIVGLLAWAGYALFPASFAIGFAFITTLTVFLLNAINPDTPVDRGRAPARHRRGRRAWPDRVRGLADLVAPPGPALAGATWSPLSAPTSPRCWPRSSTAGGPPRTRLRQRTRRARLARTKAEETIAVSLSDPADRRIDPDWSQSLLASMRRLIQAAHVLRLDVQEDRQRAPMPALAPLAERLDELLGLVESRIAAGSAAADGTEVSRSPRRILRFTRGPRADARRPRARQ